MILTLTIDYANEHDLPAFRQMAIDLMPDMTELRTPDWHHRLGHGRCWTEPLLLAVRDSDSTVSGPIGFCWADAAMADDNSVFEPWWCLNAVAVRPKYRGAGVGGKLLKAVRQAASFAGVVSLYGVCDRSLTGWYGHHGFTVLGPGEAVVSDGPVRMVPPPPGGAKTITFRDEKGECVFFTDIEPASVRRLTQKR